MSTHEKSRRGASSFVQIATATVLAPTAAPANARGILLGTAGTLNITMRNGVVVALVPLPAGITFCEVASFQTGGTGSNVWVVL